MFLEACSGTTKNRINHIVNATVMEDSGIISLRKKKGEHLRRGQPVNTRLEVLIKATSL
jgi:hypothetical protein